VAAFIACLVLCAVFSGCGGAGQDSASSEQGFSGTDDSNAPKGVVVKDDAIKLPEDPQARAVIGVRYIAFGMLLFKSHVGRLPTEEEGISAMYEEPEAIKGQQLWRGPYNDAEIVKLDPWGHDYQYRVDPELGLGYEVWSLGADGVKSDDDIIASRDAGLPGFLGQGYPMQVEEDHVHAPRAPENPVPVPGDANLPHQH